MIPPKVDDVIVEQPFDVDDIDMSRIDVSIFDINDRAPDMIAHQAKY